MSFLDALVYRNFDDQFSFALEGCAVNLKHRNFRARGSAEMSSLCDGFSTSRDAKSNAD
jgi:hypothetical protein